MLEKYFTLISDGNHDKQWISLEDFLKFLGRSNTAHDDQVSWRFRYVVKRKLVQYNKDDVITDSDQRTIISVELALRFIFNHTNEYKNCMNVTNAVLQVLGKTKTPTSVTNVGHTRSIFELYKQIASIRLRNTDINSIFGEHKSQLPSGDDIPSLFTIHRENFTEEEWGYICQFEHYYHTSTAGVEPEDLTAATASMQTILGKHSAMRQGSPLIEEIHGNVSQEPQNVFTSEDMQSICHWFSITTLIMAIY